MLYYVGSYVMDGSSPIFILRLDHTGSEILPVLAENEPLEGCGEPETPLLLQTGGMEPGAGFTLPETGGTYNGGRCPSGNVRLYV